MILLTALDAFQEKLPDITACFEVVTSEFFRQDLQCLDVFTFVDLPNDTFFGKFCGQIVQAISPVIPQCHR